jgi:N-glycosylase/DNA lyase
LNPTPIHGLESTVQIIAKDVQDSVAPIFMPRAENVLRRELICCILSSQVPYDLAVSAADGLVRSGLVEEDLLLPREDVERAVLDVLIKPLDTVNGPRRYRFPKRRAHDVAAAFELFRLCHGSITKFLRRYPDPAEARVWLVMHVPGLGPKQSSMFLRNAGHSRDLAILDRHILKYMRLIQISDLAGGVSRLKDYETEERRFAAHAASLGFPVGILDWAVWIVLRAAAQLEGAAGW